MCRVRLMMMRWKYGPGGEPDPDWKPPMVTPGPPPPPDVPPPPDDIPIARPAWRTIPQRGMHRSRNRQDPPPPLQPVPEPRLIQPWATWQPHPHLAPTPPSVEPTQYGPGGEFDPDWKLPMATPGGPPPPPPDVPLPPDDIPSARPAWRTVEPTLFVPDRGSPGLFGPRSPRDSYG